MKLAPLGGSQNDGLYRAENGTIYFRKYREGKGEIFRSCKTDKPSVAREKRDQFMSELWGDARPGAKGMRKTAGELWNVWAEGMELTKRPATAASIRSSEKHLMPFIESMFLDEFTSEWWTNVYIPKKRSETHEKRKFFNDRKWLSMFLKWAEENQKGGPNWERPKLINPDPPRDRARIFSDDEIARLYDNADWPLMTKLVMGFEHFMRRSEIALLSKSRVDRAAHTVHLGIEDTKIKKSRTFPYNDALEWLFQILDWQNAKAEVDSPFVFPSPKDPSRSIGRDGFAKSWGTCKRRARVAGKFHWTRHTGLTRAFARSRNSAALICHFAGLSLEEADRTYLHFSIDDLRGVESLAMNSPNSSRPTELHSAVYSV